MHNSNAAALQIPSNFVPLSQEEMKRISDGITVTQSMRLNDSTSLAYAMSGVGTIDVAFSPLNGGLDGTIGGLYFGKLVIDAYHIYGKHEIISLRNIGSVWLNRPILQETWRKQKWL